MSEDENKVVHMPLTYEALCRNEEHAIAQNIAIQNILDAEQDKYYALGFEEGIKEGRKDAGRMRSQDYISLFLLSLIAISVI